ncbi:hypothetical protein [[Acholeplasma] multilocale]|uniref:hypothetical protein n=1 Tax=[Acholeplasma] multilocale TaxID=264638 RepID=UPI00047B9E87|nr:hypothetical protein [[Acholeplasma] multilocale]
MRNNFEKNKTGMFLMLISTIVMFVFGFVLIGQGFISMDQAKIAENLKLTKLSGLGTLSLIMGLLFVILAFYKTFIITQQRKGNDKINSQYWIVNFASWFIMFILMFVMFGLTFAARKGIDHSVVSIYYVFFVLNIILLAIWGYGIYLTSVIKIEYFKIKFSRKVENNEVMQKEEIIAIETDSSEQE